MFKEFEEYVLRRYGMKELSQNELNHILNKATEYKIISTPNMRLSVHPTTENVLKYLKHFENTKTQKDSLSKQKSKMQTNAQTLIPHQNTTIINESAIKDNISIQNQHIKDENLIKLEKVLEAFLSYEKVRLSKKSSSSISYLLIFFSLIAFAVCFVYFNYIPEPY